MVIMVRYDRQLSSIRSPRKCVYLTIPRAFFMAGARKRRPFFILKTILQKVTGCAVYPAAMIARAAKKSTWWIEGWNRAESTTKSRTMLQSGSPSTYLPKIKSSVVNVLPFDEPRLAKINN